jgi:hypothetical protein
MTKRDEMHVFFLSGYKTVDKLLSRSFMLLANILMFVSCSGDFILHHSGEQFLSPAGPQAGCAVR